MDLTKHEKYSPEWDELMNRELQIVKGAYGYDDYLWSFTIPNEATEMKLVEYMDGDQPHYNSAAFTASLKEKGVDYMSLADYPRHNNKLRLMFAEWIDAVMALHKVKQLVG